jgi:uncharacterized protein YydD (DUF2326 family)
MFLKSLKIENGVELVRDISFHKGLNLIIDETRTASAQETGNNVGKTTVLKLIDFCLGGKGENIYRDSEFRDKINTQVEEFLKDNSIVITLTMKLDLTVHDSQEIVIRKNFLARSLKIQEINGEYYNDSDFDKKLKQLVFGTNSEKPTFRQIVSKNIRYEKLRIENTVRILHSTTNFEEYEALYFLWFGIDTDTASRKQKLQLDKAGEENVLKRLRKETSLSQINQALSVIEDDIKELDEVKQGFNVNKDYEADLQSLNDIKAMISRASTEVGVLQMRYDIIAEASAELRKQEFDVDLNEVKEIYATASALVPSIQIQFEQLVTFHNKMLDERIEFVTKELPSLEARVTELNESIRELLAQEQLIAYKIDKSGAAVELEKIIRSLNEKYQQKGRYEEQLRQWTSATAKLEQIEKDLEEINKGIASYDAELEEKIGVFNRYFSKISRKLYGEQFILSQSHNGRAYQLNVSSIGGLGTGKKKGLTAAFDIAYVGFADELGVPCLHFILHDQIESIHDNQLSLLAEVTSEANLQFVVSVLRDKLPVSLNPDQYKILSLSQDDKLFKV